MASTGLLYPFYSMASTVSIILQYGQHYMQSKIYTRGAQLNFVGGPQFVFNNQGPQQFLNLQVNG